MVCYGINSETNTNHGIIVDYLALLGKLPVEVGPSVAKEFPVGFRTPTVIALPVGFCPSVVLGEVVIFCGETWVPSSIRAAQKSKSLSIIISSTDCMGSNHSICVYMDLFMR